MYTNSREIGRESTNSFRSDSSSCTKTASETEDQMLKILETNKDIHKIELKSYRGKLGLVEIPNKRYDV